MSKTESKKVAFEVMQNQEYISSLALVAEKDKILYERTLQELIQNKVKQKDIASIEKVVKEEVKKMKNLKLVEPDELIKVKQIIPDAPVGDDVTVPSGWELSYTNGLAKITLKQNIKGNVIQDRIEVSSTAIIITERMVNKNTGTEMVKLSWIRDSKWKHHITERKNIANNQKIIDLANIGIPVTSNTAKYLVNYLSEFEAVNIDLLPKTKMSQYLGWQDDNSFLLGKNIFKIESGIDDDVTFRADDEGNQQIADGYCVKGSYEEYVKVINQLFDYPFAIGTFYFSLATPFLEILDVPNFIVDWSNKTSAGKTITLRVAASCWGNPDERKSGSVLHTWDTTKVAAGRMASILNGLPFIMDDTKLANNSNKFNNDSLVSYIIYLIVSGKEKARGSTSGLRNRGSWRTILLSSGEQPIITFTKAGGAIPRVISLWSKPFGNGDKSEFVNKVNLTVKHNYGHVGPKVIQYILNHKTEWDNWREAYLENQKIFSKKAEGNSIAIRISEYFAFLETVIPLISMFKFFYVDNGI